jgi:autotransporter-associated beta strand protein
LNPPGNDQVLDAQTHKNTEMKAKRNPLLWSLPFVVTIVLNHAVAQQESTTVWNGDFETPGNWADETWSNGVPVADSLAGILNGGTVNVTAATPILEQLHLSGGSTLNVGAVLEVAGTNAVPAVVDPPSSAIPATGVIVNAGALNVNAGGDLKMNTGGVLMIGKDATGNLNLLANGFITTDLEVQVGSGGTSGAGTLTQSGGTLTHTASLFKVGPDTSVGQFNISGGTATINSLRLKFGGNIAGQSSTFNQTGGVVNFTGETAIGWDTVANATYNLSDGTITTNNRLRVGVSNKGDATRSCIFNQTGGEVNVTGRIDIGDSTPSSVVNVYDMSGGTLTTTSQVQVGAFGNASGILRFRGTADATLAGMYVGTNATNTGTVTFQDDAVSSITNLEIRNGSVTQSGESSQVDATNRFFVGSSDVTKTAVSGTYTLADGTLNLFGTDNRVGTNVTTSATLNIEGGMLTSNSRLRVGVGKSDGTLTPTNLVNQTGGSVSIFGRLDLGEFPGPTNIYQISGGSLTATSSVLVGYFSDGTGTFTVSGTAEVNVPSVVMGENAGTIVTGTKGTVNLLGGTLTTNQIKVGNGLTTGQTLILNGGTIKARSGGTTALIAGNVTTASLLAGGITFDTEWPDSNTAAVMTGPGGLTKKGIGTLTVNNVQAYTGATRVEEGTLRLTQPYLADNGDVYLKTGAVLDLTYAEAATDTIGTLHIDGVPQPVGTYGGTGTGAATELDLLMIGNGMLNATSSGAPAEPPVITSITVAGGNATITISGSPNTSYICRFSDDLATPFAPIATNPETITTNGTGEATFSVDASVGRRFYVVGEE